MVTRFLYQRRVISSYFLSPCYYHLLLIICTNKPMLEQESEYSSLLYVPGPAAGSLIVSPASVQSSPNCFLLVTVTSTFADTSSIMTGVGRRQWRRSHVIPQTF